MFKLKFILYFLLFFFTFSQLDEEESISKVLSCITILTQKYYNKKEEKPDFLSPVMLSCFININDGQINRIITEIEEEESNIMNIFTPEEIESLTDVNSIKKIPEKKLKIYKSQLEKAIDNLQKAEKNFEKMNKGKNPSDAYEDESPYDLDDGDYDDDYDDDDYEDDDINDKIFKRKSTRVKGFWRLLIKGIKIIIFESEAILIILILICIYIILLTARKSVQQDEIIEYEDENENNIDKIDKNDNLNKNNENKDINNLENNNNKKEIMIEEKDNVNNNNNKKEIMIEEKDNVNNKNDNKKIKEN